MNHNADWMRGFNDGMACAAEECFNSYLEAAGKHLLQHVQVECLNGEAYEDLVAALKKAGETGLLQKVRRERRKATRTKESTRV